MLHAKKQDKISMVFVYADIVLFFLLIISYYFFFGIPSINKKQINSSVYNKQAYQDEAKKIADTCLQKDTEQCYKKIFTDLTKRNGFSYAEQTLYALQDIDPQLRHCHVLSHEIAKVAVRKNPQDWKKLMEEVNADICGAGFFHGVLEAHTGDDPNFKVDAAFINETCYKGQNNFKGRTCSHILGHIILLDTEGKVEPALPICGQINSSFQLDCYTGIFMEDSFKLALAEHGFAEIPVRDKKRLDRQLERCLNYTGVASVACWIDMAEIFVEFYNFDPIKAYELCNKAPFEAARKQCYLKAVILMAVSPNFDTKEDLLKACSFYTQDQDTYKQCTSFIISSLMHYSPKFADRGVKLCSNIDDAYRAYCFEDLGNQLKMNVSERGERELFCRGTPEKYKSLCVN